MASYPSRRHFLAALFVLAVLIRPVPAADQAAAPVAVPVHELGGQFRLVGRTGQPLFKFARVEGVVVEGPTKGWEGGPNLQVQRINGVATQESIRVPLRATFRDDRQRRRRAADETELVEKGRTYEFAGYEDGNFVGTPLEAYEEAGVPVTFQTRGVYLRTEFVPLRFKPIPPVVLGPADFVGRRALIQGTATSRDGKACLDGTGWRLLVRSDGAWPEWMEGKSVETQGTIRRGDDDRTFVADEPATARRVRLEDQVGRSVELRGEAWSTNGHWWFTYRGQDLYIDNEKQLPGWSVENHGRQMMIRGTLGRAMRLDLEQIALVDKPPLKEYFVVQDASWEPIDRLLAPEQPRVD